MPLSLMMPVCLGMQQRPREQVPIRCRACHRSVEAINQTGTGIEQAPLQMIGKRFEVEHDCVTRLQALAHLDHVVGAGSPHEMRCVWPAAGGPRPEKAGCPWRPRRASVAPVPPSRPQLEHAAPAYHNAARVLRSDRVRSTTRGGRAKGERRLRSSDPAASRAERGIFLRAVHRSVIAQPPFVVGVIGATRLR